MPIKGIDTEKCTNCQQCLQDCPSFNFRLSDDNQVVFFQVGCVQCGHCIAICPEDAILYEGMKDEPLSFEDVDPTSLISYDTFLKFIRGKRSIRQYKKKKIPNEIIDKIMYVMRYAPTGGNIRGLRCNIISDDEQIKALSEAVLDTLIGNPAIPENYSLMLKRKRKQGLDPIFYGASHVMIFHSPNPMDLVNSVIAITHGLLSAQTLGIGSCWLYLAQRALIDNKDLRKNVAKINGRVHGVFVLGYPAVKYARGPPRPKIRTKKLN
ncbi:MAG: hypothetical protein EU535_07300 [Promethearchaeota archaeon]|nr:MAG: hypothetical protein EU535_07300 [Candidatus Lokiarchaeota archaeon]